MSNATETSNRAGKLVDEFVISRVFDAQRDWVWKAWTERDRLMQWFGPAGVKMVSATLDFRPGGVFHYCMRTPDRKDMWGKFVYREIVPTERIVLVTSFSDANGGQTRHPLHPTWPMEMLSTTTFAEQDGKTLLTIRWAPLNPIEAERKTFDSNHDGMKMGWTGTFEQDSLLTWPSGRAAPIVSTGVPIIRGTGVPPVGDNVSEQSPCW